MIKNNLFDQTAQVKPVVWVLFLLLVSILIVGTLQIPLLTNIYYEINLPFSETSPLMTALTTVNLSFQGGLLILMLFVIGVLAWQGFEDVFEGFNAWTYAAFLAIGLTILIASPAEAAGSMTLGINGRFIGVLILLIGIPILIARSFDQEELSGWVWETWKFVKQIFPLLIIGVFAAGIVKVIIPETWVRTIAGQNTIMANFVGVVFGVFMYFPTLVEVPIAKMFLDLGMARGPLLAYLLSDPELSLQSILVLNGIMGKKKTVVYVSIVAVFSTLAGYLFGLMLTIL
jgi:uncharacterized membrane protein YraQ (UPF0718 family)